MSTDKPSRNEDEYFAKRNAELLKQAREELDQERAAAERSSHLGKCPQDGYDLQRTRLQGVDAESCPHCGGVWLDRDALAAIARHEDRPGLLGRFFGDVLTGISTTHLPPDSDENLRRAPGNPLT